MSLHPVPGIEKYPDLLRRYEIRVAYAVTGGKDCSGCSIGSINTEFSQLVKKALERDKALGRK